MEIESTTAGPFAQKTPTRKFPTLVDDETTMFESGAIVEYLLEKYGDGRLAPAVGSPLRGAFLQWVHFADATAFTGLGNIAWHTRQKLDAESVADALADYGNWVRAALDAVERALEGRPYLLGEEFSAADIGVGYTVLVAKALGLVGPGHGAVDDYLSRLTERPAFRKALSV